MKRIGNLFASYDCINLTDGTIPIEAQARFTINQLKVEFSNKLEIELDDNYRILVNGVVYDSFSAVPPNIETHDDYVNLVGNTLAKQYKIEL